MRYAPHYPAAWLALGLVLVYLAIAIAALSFMMFEAYAQNMSNLRFGETPPAPRTIWVCGEKDKGGVQTCKSIPDPPLDVCGPYGCVEMGEKK